MQFNKLITIGNSEVGEGRPPYIIAEIGVNHNGDLGLAKKMVESAVAAGANAAKFQTFKAETLSTKSTEKVAYQKKSGPQDETHYEMLRKLEMSDSMHKELIKFCSEKNIEFLSTPYTIEDAKYLQELSVSAFKIASADIVDIPLLEFCAKTRKPVIVSAGMATMEEIKEAVNIFVKYDNPNLVLLHCTSRYPTPNDAINLKVINTLKKEFQCLVGFSDHSEGNYAAIAAVALGACILEKHFTLDKSLPGPDHKASTTPDEFSNLITGVKAVYLALGSSTKSVDPGEIEMRKTSRKSVVLREDVKKGTLIEREHLTCKRPGTGILPKHIDKLVGKKTKRDIRKDELISFEDIM